MQLWMFTHPFCVCPPWLTMKQIHLVTKGNIIKLLLITALSPNWLYFLIYSICLNFMKIFSMTCTSLQPAPNLWNMEEQYCRIIKALSQDSGKNKWFLHKPDIRGQCTFSPHPFRCARNVIMTLNQNPSWGPADTWWIYQYTIFST